MPPHVKLYLGSLLLAASQAEASMQVCRDDAGRRFLLQAYQTAPDGWNCADDKVAPVPVQTSQTSQTSQVPGLRLLQAKGQGTPRLKLTPATARPGRRRNALDDSILITYSPPDPRLLLAPAYAEPRSYPRSPRRKLDMPAAAQRYDALIREVARAHGHDPNLLRAIIHVESRFNASAISPKGAIGLMQVMPSTAADLGLRNARRALFEPQSNLNVGALYLKRLSERFKGNVVLMVAAFNAGENAVARYGNTIPPYAETAGLIQKDRVAHAAQAAGSVEQARASLEQSRQGEAQARSAVAHNDWRIEKFEEQLRKLAAEQALAEAETADEEAEESSIARMVMGRVQWERAGDDARR